MVVYLVFVAGILFFAFKANNQRFDLVQKDYYADELKYQEVIDASARAKDAGGELVTNEKNGHLTIQLPAAFNGVASKGVAHLYYAADAQKDIRTSFSTKEALVDIELLSTTKGSYTLKLDIEKEGNKYYYEKKVFL